MKVLCRRTFSCIMSVNGKQIQRKIPVLYRFRKRIVLMRKLIAVVLTLALLCPVFGAPAEEAARTENGAAQAELIPSLWDTGAEHRIVRKTFPFYVGSLELPWPEEFPLYFADGADDLPFMELNDFAAFMNYLWVNLAEDYQFTVDANPDTGIVMCKRETGSTVTFNFTNSRIVWPDYFGFLHFDTDMLDYLGLLGSLSGKDKEGQPYLLSRAGARERGGRPVYLDLKEYGIPMLAQDGLFLVPVQTLSAFFLNNRGLGFFFNGKSLILARMDSMNVNTARQVAMLLILEDMQESMDSGADFPQDREAQTAMLMQRLEQKMAEPSLLNTWLEGPKEKRSLSLRDFAVRELAMELDHLYGLRETHDIDSFMMFFLQTGMYEDLMSEDTVKADQAVRDMVSLWLDDGHSTYYGDSYLLETPTVAGNAGYSNQAFRTRMAELTALRARHAGTGEGSESFTGYYETGNTAYITLDVFNYMGSDYYGAPEEPAIPGDTCGQIIEAHRRITRENSPIENVVLYLTCNTGGHAAAAVYTLCWFLGDAQLSAKDSFSGAETTTVYRADVNLDRVFDEQDTLAGRGLNLYCLISPVSFSCGNLVPWAFKTDGRVKLLGGRTRGGSCEVQPMSTAWGTTFAVSGPLRISFMINGAYYDVDQGAEPDYVIRDYNHLYDREALTDYINGLF